MKKLFLVLGIFALAVSCTPEDNAKSYDNQQAIDKEEIQDDDI